MHVIGKGRQAREVYPQSPGAAGGSAARRPLTRQRWIDATTTTPGNGSEATPYLTPQTFLADPALFPAEPASADDANTMIVGLVTPAAIDVFGAQIWNIPAYRNITLRALETMPAAKTTVSPPSFTPPQGSTIEDIEVTWTNTAAAAGNPSFAADVNVTSLVFDSLFLIGMLITITDDGTVPSQLIFLGQAPRVGAVTSTGVVEADIIASGATAFESVIVLGQTMDGIEIDTPTAVWLAERSLLVMSGFSSSGPAASVGFFFDCLTDLSGATSAGMVFDNEVSLDGCTEDGSVITSTNGDIIVTNTQFNTSTSLTVLSSTAAIVFDGPSRLSFIEQGGVTSGTVLVVGGFSGAPVLATPISATSGGVTVSLADGNYFPIPNGLTGTLTVSLDSTHAEPGDVIRVASADRSGNLVLVFDATSNTNVITGDGSATVGLTFPGTIDAVWTGSAWTFFGAGQIATK